MLDFANHPTANLREQFQRNLSLSKQLRFDLMIVDIELAFTFLHVAQGSSNENTIRRNRQNARRAYEIVFALLETRNFDQIERDAIQMKLRLLKKRLDEFNAGLLPDGNNL